ncbi:MAG: TIGR02996 domain-containing protein [Planctomycetia bacterium]|nr:TIGR02996 domain-containing protein [Planctomycetia bacterium]
MDEEAAFIAAMLAEPDDRTTLLVYADWLDERGDPRGEYLRLLAAEKPNKQRLMRLRRTLDPIWAHQVTNRRFPIGARVRILDGACVGIEFNRMLVTVSSEVVRILDGAFVGIEGELTGVCADWRNVTVRVTIWGRPVDVEVALTSLERIEEVK